MDVQSFSEESFDPVTWIDKSFDQVPADGNRENHATGLVYKLQLFLQEINSSLEETAEQVIRSLPFVMKQAEALDEEIQTLKTKTDQIAAQLAAVHQSESMDRIRFLHDRVRDACPQKPDDD
jgi:phage shock protein A